MHTLTFRAMGCQMLVALDSRLAPLLTNRTDARPATRVLGALST